MNDRIPGFCVEGRPICVESMRFENYWFRLDGALESL